MAKFSKNNFVMIIHEIEDMEAADQNIWVPIGILEIMYDDYAGIIDKYFHSKNRDIDELWNDLKNKVTTINGDYWFFNKEKAVPLDVTPKITWDNIGNGRYRTYSYATVPCNNDN